MISPSSLLISIEKPTCFSGNSTTAVRKPNTAPPCHTILAPR
jgi:hypothetical protein